MPWLEIPKPDAEFDDDYVRLSEDSYEISFRSRLPDGTPTVGRIIGLAGVEPPTIIFEERPTDLSRPPVVRKFNHGTPENVRSIFAIKGAPERFLGEIRVGLKWLLRSEMFED